ncbi:MAG: ribosomal protein S18-alanine N-acetyltransferase [Clostridia bacterium]|nr:ribosomal protein S18-alanine N-acetyltransferase [Clostridia bacterium]
MIEILRLDASHIDGMEKIENTCFSEPWSRRSLEELLSCDYAVYFVAYDNENGAVAGYGGMYVSVDCGAVNNIGVLPEYRRRGIGERLLSALTEYSENNGITLMTLEVRESNIPAIGLYEKHGFTLVGTRKNYYKKPTENGLLYNKEIVG